MTKIEEALRTFPTLPPEQQETVADFIINSALPVIDFDGDQPVKNAAH